MSLKQTGTIWRSCKSQICVLLLRNKNSLRRHGLSKHDSQANDNVQSKNLVVLIIYLKKETMTSHDKLWHYKFLNLYHCG